MEEATRARIYNLKGHIRLTEIGIQKLKTALKTKEVKTHNNFLVVKVKEGGHTYIIFPDVGFINITGVKGFSQVNSIIPRFCDTFGLSRLEIAGGVEIDNISASGNFQKRVNLEILKSTLNKSKSRGERLGKIVFTVHFDRNFFPGAFCKTRGYGTLTVFQSGKYVVVGAKCQQDLEEIVHEMFAVITTL